MRAGHGGGIRLTAGGTADAFHFIRSQRHPDAGAADQDPLVAFAGDDRIGRTDGKNRIIAARGAVGAEIHIFQPHIGQQFLNIPFHIQCSVVTRDRNHCPALLFPL